jgi:tetratricopeptide (TPR) repeat protein
MAKIHIPKPVIPDPETIPAKTNLEIIERGWLFYSRKSYDRAILDFLKVLETDSQDPDLLYALALSYKGTGNSSKAIEVFEKVYILLDNLDDHTKARMLQRLVHGHINQINNGDWNLEKEIWHYVR